MVDLRECLWRVPVALTHMVDIEERSRASMERCCKVRILRLLSTMYNKNTILLQVSNAGVTLPSAFTRERNNVKRKGIFRPRSMVIEDETNTHTSPASPGGYFTQQHTDAKIFMEEHFMVSQRSMDSEVYLDLLSPGEDLTLSLVPPDCQERQPMAQLQEDAAKVWETTF